MQSLKQIINLKKLYLVDRHQGIVREVPRSGAFKICVRPEEWDIGKIYVPPGAVLVNACSARDAMRKVEELFECAPPENVMDLILEGPGASA